MPSLRQWIESNLSSYSSQVVAWLQHHGYSKETLENDLMSFIEFSPRLLLNSFYEALLHSDFQEEEKAGEEPSSRSLSVSSEQAITLLSPLVALSNEFESSRNNVAFAHFIWVGPPTDTEKELIGVNSLLKTRPDQPIRFWVLEEHKAAYEKKFHDKKNVIICAIEEYAKKINISFDKDEKITLHSQIEFLRNRADRTFARLSNENIDTFIDEGGLYKNSRKTAIRDRVSIVDYIKTVIPLYEGGWIFDADIIFLSDDHSIKPNLSLNPTWIFPQYQGRQSGDVWFFYACRELNWNVDKSKAGTFKEYMEENPAWQNHLLAYHKAIMATEILRNSFNPTRLAIIFGSAVKQMIHLTDDKESYKSFFLNFDKLTIEPIKLASWYQKIEDDKIQARKISYLDAKKDVFSVHRAQDDSKYAMGLGCGENQGIYIVDIDFLKFIKRMNSSHRLDLPTGLPIEFIWLTTSDTHLIELVLKALENIYIGELLNQLRLTVYFFKGRSGKSYKINLEKLRTIDLLITFKREICALILPKILNALNSENLRTLIMSEIALPPDMKKFLNLESEENTLKFYELVYLADQKEKGDEKHFQFFPIMLHILNEKHPEIAKMIPLQERNISNYDFTNLNLSGLNLNDIIISGKNNFSGVNVENCSCDHLIYFCESTNEKIEINISEFVSFTQRSTPPHSNFSKSRDVDFFKEHKIGSQPTQFFSLLSQISDPSSRDEVVVAYRDAIKTANTPRKSN